MAKAQRDGYRGMANVKAVLSARGRQVEVAGYHAPFDLLVDGKHRVEVKTCTGLLKKKNGVKNELTWQFNIHRHGRLVQEQVDFYILRMEGVPGFKSALHLLFVSPIRRKILAITMRSLLDRYAENVKMFHDFKRGVFSALTRSDI